MTTSEAIHVVLPADAPEMTAAVADAFLRLLMKAGRSCPVPSKGAGSITVTGTMSSPPVSGRGC